MTQIALNQQLMELALQRKLNIVFFANRKPEPGRSFSEA
jgi:hypothetical protein